MVQAKDIYTQRAQNAEFVGARSAALAEQYSVSPKTIRDIWKDVFKKQTHAPDQGLEEGRRQPSPSRFLSPCHSLLSLSTIAQKNCAVPNVSWRESQPVFLPARTHTVFPPCAHTGIEPQDSFLGNADSNDGNPSETTQEKCQSKDAFKRRSKQA